jgi:hypothetical protein
VSTGQRWTQKARTDISITLWCLQVDQNERQIGNPSQIFDSCLGSASPNLDRWSRSCGHRKRENGDDGSPSRNTRDSNEIGNDVRATIDFAAGQTARLICKIKMGLLETSFVLYREDQKFPELARLARQSRRQSLRVHKSRRSGRDVRLARRLPLNAIHLRKMSKREMDPSGRTLIGMILGAIGFILNVGLIVTMLVLHISLF